MIIKTTTPSNDPTLYKKDGGEIFNHTFQWGLCLLSTTG